ncbi:MAG TPA: choice-of-anchor Q domain-containing protein [Tepidisphaeraceae bacterium]
MAGAAFLLVLLQGVGHAATITVTTNNPAINDGDGKCSLIEAIVNANDQAATHPDCLAGSAPDTIVLPKGNHVLTAVDNSTYEDTGLPVISSAITIEGNGAKVIRKGSAPSFHLLAVATAGDLTLKDLTLSGGVAANFGGAIRNNGILSIQNSTISDNAARTRGGGISDYGAALTIQNSTISGNRSSLGGAGVHSYGDALSIENSTISGNTDGYSGGGVAFYGGTATIANSTIFGNTAKGRFYTRGAGIVNYGAMTIDQSTVSKNQAIGAQGGIGAGVFTGDRAALTITNSVIARNKASGSFRSFGGGIFIVEAMTMRNSTVSGNVVDGPVIGGHGGGIYAEFASVTVENSTISGNIAKGKYSRGGGISVGGNSAVTIDNSTISSNTATETGGGFYNSGTLDINSSTISHNQAKLGPGGGIRNSFGTLTLVGSLISGNKGAVGPEVENENRATIIADNYNLFGAKNASGVVGFTPGATDIVPGPAIPFSKILGPLKANGGPTKTHALKPTSPAVDAIPAGNPACPATDQRGISRPQGPNCDIGAFELE